MTGKKLHELLQQLHDELERAGTLSDTERKELLHLGEDIQKLVGQPDAEQQPVRSRLQEAIDRFEVEHPAITAALSQMLNTLSNAGI